MTITNITVSGVVYVAYASEAEAEAYMAVDPVRKDAWDVLTSDQKKVNIISATKRLDLLTWTGEKTSGASQVNAWPRTGVVYSDGTAVSTSEVPREVQDATCSLAGSITIDASTSEAGTSGTNTKRVKAGSAEVEFFRPDSGKALQDETAFTLITIFLSGPASGDTGNFASGTGCESSFNDATFPGLTQGFP